MYSMMVERKCRGVYLRKGRWEEFEDGIFHGFGIDFEEFDSGPAQFTTAIVELADGLPDYDIPGQMSLEDFLRPETE